MQQCAQWAAHSGCNSINYNVQTFECDLLYCPQRLLEQKTTRAGDIPHTESHLSFCGSMNDDRTRCENIGDSHCSWVPAFSIKEPAGDVQFSFTGAVSGQIPKSGACLPRCDLMAKADCNQNSAYCKWGRVDIAGLSGIKMGAATV